MPSEFRFFRPTYGSVYVSPTKARDFFHGILGDDPSRRRAASANPRLHDAVKARAETGERGKRSLVTLVTS